MKATNTITSNIIKSLIIFASVFSIQINSSYAEKNMNVPAPLPLVNTFIRTLAPASPETCDFNDAELNINDFSNLAPSFPDKADFNEPNETFMNLINLTPVIPSEADFSDSEPANTDITSLAPVTPSEADFTI
ncbi:MAG: hypothetical protein NTU51_02615 [Bacteroidetes bacterium]|nr:hypothetical protein [Bacteroidota bacterium]